jgi:hypothetical protein
MSCTKVEAEAERRYIARGFPPATSALSTDLGRVDRNAGHLVDARKVLQHVGAFCPDRVVALVPHRLEKAAK